METVGAPIGFPVWYSGLEQPRFGTVALQDSAARLPDRELVGFPLLCVGASLPCNERRPRRGVELKCYSCRGDVILVDPGSNLPVLSLVNAGPVTLVIDTERDF